MKRAALIAVTAALVASCLASVASAADTASWPSATGTLEGSTSAACAVPVVLTSGDTDPGYGVFNFDVAAGTTFESLGLNFDITYLEGGPGGGSPRISVFLANGDTWFVYAYDVNPGGDVQNYEDFTDHPGTYLTRDQAMATADAAVLVDGASLVVDAGWSQEGGVQSIQVNGVLPGGCNFSTAAVRPPNQVFVCNSKWQTEPDAFYFAQASALLKQGFWEPYAVGSTTASKTQIKGEDGTTYSLVCNTTLKPTGLVLGDAGEIRVPLDLGIGFAKIVK